MSAVALQTVARGRVVLAGCPPVPYTIWWRLGESLVRVESCGVERLLQWNGATAFRPDSREHLAAVIERFDAGEPQLDDDALERLNRELTAERSKNRRTKEPTGDRQLPAGDRA